MQVLGAHVAQSVERVLGKDEVSSSILLVGSMGSLYVRRQVCYINGWITEPLAGS